LKTLTGLSVRTCLRVCHLLDASHLRKHPRVQIRINFHFPSLVCAFKNEELRVGKKNIYLFLASVCPNTACLLEKSATEHFIKLFVVKYLRHSHNYIAYTLLFMCASS
jgi:hypothetical protein